MSEPGQDKPFELPASPCHKCMSLCCISLKIPGDAFRNRKDAGVICPHLKSGKCDIHAMRTQHGMGSCERYFCGGAGEFVTEIISSLFPGFDRRNEPPKESNAHTEWNRMRQVTDHIFQLTHYTFQRMYWLQEAIKNTKDENVITVLEQTLTYLKVLSGIFGKKLLGLNRDAVHLNDPSLQELTASYLERSEKALEELMSSDAYKAMVDFYAPR